MPKHSMRLEYDKEVDAAYLYLQDTIRDGEATKTVRVNDDVALDFDDKGKLLGAEILNASKVMKKKVLLEAQAA